MRAVVLDERLALEERPPPLPGPGQLLLRVQACGVCRTDLHLLDGEVADRPSAADARPPDRRHGRADGRRVGVPWLGWTCGECRYCPSGRENLCERARFTGRDIDGGFAEYAVADERFCFAIPAASPTSRPRRCCAPG